VVITATTTPAPTPVPVTEQEFKERYQRFLTELKASIGFSEADLRRVIADNLLREKVREAIVADVPTVMEQVHARHILVDMEDEAKEVLERLKQGEDFAALAAELSIDSGTKDKGGDLGWFPRGEMDPAFEEAAFALAPGELSDPVQSSFGWHIIQVLERDPARPLSPDQLDRQRSNAFNQWLTDMKAQSDIQRFPIEDKVPPLGLLATPIAP
jgi:parvulin-like peptidyl-prolyl isomerase